MTLSLNDVAGELLEESMGYDTKRKNESYVDDKSMSITRLDA